MKKFTTYIEKPTVRNRGTSLGLHTPISLELKLLEVAMRGKNALEKLWEQEASGSYDINGQVMCLEILREIEFSEKDGNINSLIERAQNQVVKLKGNESLHHRATVVYRYFVNLSESREGIVNGSSLASRDENIDFSNCLVRESKVRESKEYSRSSQIVTIDEKLEEMLNIELPETLEEESSTAKETCMRTTQGEPSASSGEVVTLNSDASCEALSIFERPTITNEGVANLGSPINPVPHGKISLSPIWLNAESTDEGGSILTLGNIDTPHSQFSPRYTPHSQLLIKKSLGLDDSDLKIDFEGEKPPEALGKFPGKDFKQPIEWKVDRNIFKAQSLPDLRRNHNILMEGTFRKRYRYRTWRNHYGFILDTGVMVYFRKGVYKGFADFRKSNPNLPNNKQFKLQIKGVHSGSKETDWRLKFENVISVNSWYEAILKISKSHQNYGLEQMLGSPKLVN